MALIKGKNIYWDYPVFYGSLDRHNREFTPEELLKILHEAGIAHYDFFMINTPCNWNSHTSDDVYQILGKINADSFLLYNTNFVIARP